MSKKDDAWRQLHDLLEKYTKEWDFRPDLEVVADATGRCIRLGDVSHNVDTIREYVAILGEACDFVEQANPEWARLRRV